MLDIKMVREHFDEVKEKLQTRGVPEENLTEFLRLDKKRRSLLVETEEKKKYRNNVSEKIAQAKRNKEDTSEQISEMREIGSKIKELDKELADIDESLKNIATALPNLPHSSVPIGDDEEDNVEVRNGTRLKPLILSQKTIGILQKNWTYWTLNEEQKFRVVVLFTTKD